MPLEDILRGTLFKNGLTAPMAVRQYVQAAWKMEQQVSTQDYLRRRRLNPGVFKLFPTNYLWHCYRGKEAAKWRGYGVVAVEGSRVEVPVSSPEIS